MAKKRFGIFGPSPEGGIAAGIGGVFQGLQAASEMNANRAKAEALRAKALQERNQAVLSAAGLSREQRVYDPLRGTMSVLPGVPVTFDENGNVQVSDVTSKKEPGSPDVHGAGKVTVVPSRGRSTVGGGEVNKAVDANFGKQYADFIAGGGRERVNQDMATLDASINALRSGEVKTNQYGSGYLGEGAQPLFNPKYAQLRSNVRSVMMPSMKIILPSRYTQPEFNNVLDNALDPKMDSESNAKRLERLRDTIKIKADAMEAAGQYAKNNHGSLEGYTGQHPSADISDFDMSKNSGAPSSSRTGGAVAVSNGKETNVLQNPTAQELSDAESEGFRRVQ